jgi:hypothetical protein
VLKVPPIFSWRVRFFYHFPSFLICSFQVHNKFTSCSQIVPPCSNYVPWHVPNYTFYLFHMLWQMLCSSYLYRWGKGAKHDFSHFGHCSICTILVTIKMFVSYHFHFRVEWKFEMETVQNTFFIFRNCLKLLTFQKGFFVSLTSQSIRYIIKLYLKPPPLLTTLQNWKNKKNKTKITDSNQL